jgi:invasion protein IalB
MIPIRPVRRRVTLLLTMIAAAGILLTASSSAEAQGPRLLGQHRDWSAFTHSSEDGTVCYVASEPKKQEGNYQRRGSPYVIVARRSAKPGVDEVSVYPGYNYKQGSEVEVAIDGDDDQFDLFTHNEAAWAYTEAQDQQLVEAMKGGVNMSVRGTSTRDTYSLDTYSLLGFTAAHEEMAAACQ